REVDDAVAAVHDQAVVAAQAEELERIQVVEGVDGDDSPVKLNLDLVGGRRVAADTEDVVAGGPRDDRVGGERIGVDVPADHAERWNVEGGDDVELLVVRGRVHDADLGRGLDPVARLVARGAVVVPLAERPEVRGPAVDGEELGPAVRGKV